MRKLILVLALFLTSGCLGDTGYSSLDVVRDHYSEDVPAAHCSAQHVEGYNASLSSYVDSSAIRIGYVDKPEGVDINVWESYIQEAIRPIQDNILIPIGLADDIGGKADIMISIINIDGPGETLGQAYFPPISKYTPRPTPLQLDKLDFGKYPFNYNIVSVLRHEILHAIGIRHSDYPDALMWWKYKVSPNLGLDDIVAIREIYRNLDDFVFDGATYTYIYKSKDYIARNFTYNEFYSKCRDDKPHWIDRSVIDALQFLRDTYGPIRITSSFRHPECNAATRGASTRSQHMNHRAVDFKFIYSSSTNKYRRDIKTKGSVYRMLRDLGINGFGTYVGNFHHIDSRPSLAIWGFDKAMSLDSAIGVD